MEGYPLLPPALQVILFVICSRKHGLSDDTIDFIGHALALHRDDRYLSEPALDTVKRMKVCPDCRLFTFFLRT